ncbi:MAG: trypsin-like peptidase domain-containing protein [Clostridiales bacterium]|jgi:serine protease Do|nr:trypsin-like peptidase domain-containing protein [Clostridiales bacterium]
MENDYNDTNIENVQGTQPVSDTPQINYDIREPAVFMQSPHKPKKKNGGVKNILMGFVGGVLGSAIILSGYIAIFQPNSQNISGDDQQQVQQVVEQQIKQVNVSETVSSPVTAIAMKVSPSVVGIVVTSEVNTGFWGGTQEQTGEGSGIVYTEDGYIITNYHVISETLDSTGERDSSATLDVYLPTDPDTAIPATIVGYDISSDLAVLKIDKTGLTPIEIGDSDNIKAGDSVIAVGNPGGLEFMGSVSSGIVSGLNRTIQLENYGDLKLIQTDAAINPGNSGGALVNGDGKLIGVNSAKLTEEGFEGMGFAIPSNYVADVCGRIIENKDNKLPYLGIEDNPNYSSAILQRMGYPEGVLVGRVAPGSPAETAGVIKNDIVTAFNGKNVTTIAELNNEKNKCKSGDQVDITVFRNGNTITFKLILAESI